MTQRVAIVTGSSRGIGRGIALTLAEAGWGVVINYRGNQQAAEATAAELKAFGATSLVVRADMAEIDELNKLVDLTLQQFGVINMLVNNAGIGPRVRADMLQMSKVSFDEVMNVNLRGPFFLTQRVANEMIRMVTAGKLSAPKIINISSISAYTSSPQRAEYCISKAGLSMTTSLWADRLAEFGINVYEIRPGIIQTDLTSVVKDKYDHLILEERITPIQRWGTPEDVGKAVLAIAEDLLPFTTGEVINVDGGFHISRL